MRFLLAAALLAAPAAASAEGVQVWINPGFFSHHLKHDQDYREDNYGFGVEVFVQPRHGFLAGSYINSNYERSHYAGYHWRPWARKAGEVSFRAGVVFALVDGYSNTNEGYWFPAVLPVLSAEYGPYVAAMSLLPNPSNGVALALQLRLQVW